MENRYFDIYLACALGLEGGLKKYAHLVPNLSRTQMDFIHEWNMALLSVLKKPGNKMLLGPRGRAMLALKSPKFTAWTLDKIAVPYRSFYYAHRFADAYNTIGAGVGPKSTVVEYGNRFSPFVPMLMLDTKTNGCVMDSALNQSLVGEVCGVMKIKCPELWLNGGEHKITEMATNGDANAFVALGSMVYNPIGQQHKIIQSAANYKHLFVEVDAAPSPDAALVKKVAYKNSYKGAWNRDALKAMLEPENISVRTLSERAAFTGHVKLRDAIDKACEVYLVR